MNSNEYILDVGGGSEPLLIVGQIFEPGREANIAILEMTGFETKVDGAKLMHRFPGGEWEKAPEFCKNTKEAARALINLGALFTTFQDENGWFGVMIWDDSGAMTKVFKKESHALACMVHHILLDRQSRVT